MANANHEISIFDEVESEIRATFSKILAQLNNRRDQLLARLNERRAEYEEVINNIREKIDSLEQVKSQLKNLIASETSSMKILESSLPPIEQKIRELRKTFIQPPHLVFKCPLNELITKMNRIGSIVVDEKVVTITEHEGEKPIDFSKKTRAIQEIGKRGIGKGEFEYPGRIYLDSLTKQIFVPDCGNNRIQVLDAMTGDFVCEFGKGQMYSECVATNETYCYVTYCNAHKVLQYRKSDFRVVKRLTKVGGTKNSFNRPTGIIVSPENEVLICDCWNHRVCVFDAQLNFKREIGLGYLRYPQCIQFKDDTIYILDWSEPNCLHSFNLAGEEISSILTMGDEKQIQNPMSFCFGPLGTILVTDYSVDTIKVFSANGDILHKIGQEAPNSETLTRCCGIAVYQDKIFVSCEEPLHCIKII